MDFSDAEFVAKRKQTRREKFLTEMDQVIPWSRLTVLIESTYPKGKGGRPPYPLEKMLRIHFMQQWFALSDPAMEESLYDSQSMRQFAGLSLTRGSLPDETTILNFRHLLERNDLATRLMSEVNAMLGEREEDAVFGDSGYLGADKRVENDGCKAQWHVAMKPSQRRAIANKGIGKSVERIEKLKVSVRAKVEHQFRLIKCQFGYRKVRYRGLVKNTAQIVTLFALSNLWMVRRRLMSATG